MAGLSESEILFYGGIAIMLLAAAVAALSAVVFIFCGRRLKRKLEEEFGKERC